MAGLVKLMQKNIELNLGAGHPKAIRLKELLKSVHNRLVVFDEPSIYLQWVIVSSVDRLASHQFCYDDHDIQSRDQCGVTHGPN